MARRRSRKGASGRRCKGRKASSRNKKHRQRRRQSSAGDAHCTACTVTAEAIPTSLVQTEQLSLVEQGLVSRDWEEPLGTYRVERDDDDELPLLLTYSKDSGQINNDKLSTEASSSETVCTNKKPDDISVLQSIVDDIDGMHCDECANQSHELCNTFDTDTKQAEWDEKAPCGMLHQSTTQRFGDSVSVDIICDSLAISPSHDETVITLKLVVNEPSSAAQDEGCLRVEEMQAENCELFAQSLKTSSAENGKNLAMVISTRRDHQNTTGISAERTSMRSPVSSPVAKQEQRRWLVSQDGTGSLKNECQASVTTDVDCEDNATHLDSTETPFLTPPENEAPQGGKPLEHLPRSLSKNASKQRKRKVIAYERASPIFNDIQQQPRRYSEIGRESAGDLGRRLLERGMTRVDSEGHRDGHWLIDTTIYLVMQQILCNPQLPLFQGESYDDVDMIHLDMRPGAVLTYSEAHGHLSQNHAALIVHMDVESDTGYHYSLIIVNVAHKQVHIFDTMARWRNDHAWNLIRQSFPNINFWRRNFRLANHTGHPRQSGATCGAWACWLAVAYAMNFRGCRSSTDQVDTTKMQEGAVEFWRSVTF